MNGFLLDMHYWLWFQMGNEQRLDAKARDRLLQMQMREELYLSDVSVWEVARLVADGHIDLGASIEDFLHEATRDGGLHLLPITTRILIQSTQLPGEIHRDPSDRLLVATARAHSLTLVTRDQLLLRYSRKGHVRAQEI